MKRRIKKELIEEVKSWLKDTYIDQKTGTPVLQSLDAQARNILYALDDR